MSYRFGKFVKFLPAAILLSFLICVVSCSNFAGTNENISLNNSVQETNNANAAKDDVEELATIINLPDAPEEVVWREEQTSDPNEKKLTAVLKYSSEAAAKIIASAAKNQPPSAAEISSENWFPAEITAQSQLSGNESVKVTAYDARDFYKPPYKNGKLLRVNDTNYLVLELTSY